MTPVDEIIVVEKAPRCASQAAAAARKLARMQPALEAQRVQHQEMLRAALAPRFVNFDTTITPTPAMIAVAASLLTDGVIPSDPAEAAAMVQQATKLSNFYPLLNSGCNSTLHGGVPLGEFVSDDPAVTKALVAMKNVLPPSMMALRVELDGWSADQVARLAFLLNSKKNVFSVSKWDIGYCGLKPFSIALREGASPCHDRPYRYSPVMTGLIRVEIDKLLAAGIIRPSNSEWASPVVGVIKPDGTARITVNYKKVNAMSIIPRVPLPLTEDVLNQLGGSDVFTVMDITSGYFTSAIAEESIPLTAMITSFGLFEWLRCPQGAAGAPGHFTRLMSMVLQGLERIDAYIDDIILHSTGVDQHLGDLELLFARLEKHGIKLAPAKLHMGCRSVKFLGHIVEVGGIRADPAKIQGLMDMPVPRDVSALRSWLGLANYYRRFIRDMAFHISPLTALMAKDVPFAMGKAQIDAMWHVNHSLALHTLMVYPDYEAANAGRPFVLTTDASKLGFGAVLSQADVHGDEQPIAFISKATLPNQKNWSTTDLEAGAIVFGVQKLRHILWGSPFVIQTDHRALEFIDTCRDKTARLARWFEFLSAFQYDIRYKPGVHNGNADCMSRNPLPCTAADVQQEKEDEVLEAYVIESYMVDCDTPEQQLALANQELLSIFESVDSAVGTDTFEQLCKLEVTNRILWPALVGKPSTELGKMSVADWRLAQRADPQILLIASFVEKRSLPVDKAEASLVRRLARGCLMQDGLLVRAEWESRTRTELPQVQLVVPLALRDQVLNNIHNSAWGGHSGVRRTLAQVRHHSWWPTVEADVAYWVEHCWSCQSGKRTGKLNRWPQVPRDMPPCAFDTLGIDIFGPLPVSAGGFKYVLVIQDMFSRWVEIFALSDATFTAHGVAEILIDQWCTRHGVPRRLLSDRGAQFMGALALEVYNQMGIRKLFTTAYHPQTNGMVERFMQTLAQMLAMVVNSAHSDWDLWLPHVAFAYNSSEHAATGVTPFMLATGREPRIAMHQILGAININADSGISVTIRDMVTALLSRQAQAQNVAFKRHELARDHIIRTNEKLAAAFGLRHQFVSGDKVWVYRAPRTHLTRDIKATGAATAEDPTIDGAGRTQLSRKFLQHWQGPFEVLAVGPSMFAGKPVVANVLVVRQNNEATRLTVHLCKRCKDPTSLSDRPVGLPTGFAKYLLVNQHANVVPPTSLTDDEVTWESDRHGVEAILDHRLVTAARGRASQLQYLVRWEGHRSQDHFTKTWEPQHLCDSCPEALNEYWATLRASGGSVRGGDTQVVKDYMGQSSRRRPGQIAARGGSGTYQLPAGNSALVACPSAAVLADNCFIHSRIFMVFDFDAGLPTGYRSWCEGIVQQPVALGVRGRTRGRRTARAAPMPAKIFWLDDNKSTSVVLDTLFYNCLPNGGCGSWFVFGSPSELAGLHL